MALFHSCYFFRKSSKDLFQKGLLVDFKLPCNNKNVCFSCRISEIKLAGYSLETLCRCFTMFFSENWLWCFVLSCIVKFASGCKTKCQTSVSRILPLVTQTFSRSSGSWKSLWAFPIRGTNQIKIIVH